MCSSPSHRCGVTMTTVKLFEPKPTRLGVVPTCSCISLCDSCGTDGTQDSRDARRKRESTVWRRRPRLPRPACTKYRRRQSLPPRCCRDPISNTHTNPISNTRTKTSHQSGYHWSRGTAWQHIAAQTNTCSQVSGHAVTTHGLLRFSACMVKRSTSGVTLPALPFSSCRGSLHRPMLMHRG